MERMSKLTQAHPHLHQPVTNVFSCEINQDKFRAYKAIQTSNAECFERFPVINHFENQLQLLLVRTANKFSSVPWKEKGEKIGNAS
jgi:hypothetical protein